ncbi:Hypothetical protein PHPALM_20252 [Phytophthora palmivora]|uniref:Transmembrane protein n=1 Tax=Phytophthora palmivora TaxID=4796 RepID=A0A2P4XFC6_9STRA|nr:Hypothetical protein PHPALM_20252 [Phytophthora palmivora]
MLKQVLSVTGRAWNALNVGHKGSFSAKRLLQLHNFIEHENQRCRSRWLWTVVMALWTPIPCLSVALLSETLPLTSPMAGPNANGFFWVRSWLVQGCYTYAVFLQVLHCIPILPQRYLVLIPISAMISAAHTAVHFVVASTLGFPVPFSSLVLDTPWIMFIVAALWTYIGPACRSSSQVHHQLKKLAIVIYASSSLAIIYPLFYYAFLVAKNYSHTQIMLTLLVLPVIKLLEKLLLYRITSHIPDLQPVYIAFNVEVFNALFVSSCMRNATSTTVTISLMSVDFVGSSAALYGLRDLMAQIDKMNAKMGSLVKREQMLEIAAMILLNRPSEKVEVHQGTGGPNRDITRDLVSRQIKHQFTASITPLHAVTSSTENQRTNIGKDVFKTIDLTALPTLPSKSPLKKSIASNNEVISFAPSTLISTGPTMTTRHYKTPSIEIINRLSSKEQQLFVLEASRVLRRVETLMIIEYTEVIVPVLYCTAIYIAAVYYLPNRIYFSYLRDLSEAELASAVQSVLVYGTLQMLSFVLLIFALDRHFQLFPSIQLQFALSSEGKLVQSLLILWVMYVLQTSLDHVGTDYTFKFEWLRAHNP